MIYSIAADALLIIHLAFILFVLVGGLLILKWRWIVTLHLPAVCWGVLVEFNHWICPLTPWENALRRSAGETSYETGFIEHYLSPIIYPAQLTDQLQLILGGIVIVINMAIYSWLIVKINKH